MINITISSVSAPLRVFAIIFVSLHPNLVEAQTKTEVGLELVLALDSSTSVDPFEFELQKRGLYEAFLHPDVIKTVKAHGTRGIAIAVTQWAGRGQQRTVVPWKAVKDERSAKEFALLIARSEREIEGFTDVAGAMAHAANIILTNNFVGDRLVVDISGDGTGKLDRIRETRTSLLSNRITINGLVIHNFEYDLGDLARENLYNYYRNNVIGGPGSFLISANGFEDFRNAIRRKLIREIRGPVFSQNYTPAIKVATAPRPDIHHNSSQFLEKLAANTTGH